MGFDKDGTVMKPTEAETAEVRKTLEEAIEHSKTWTGVVIMGIREGGVSIGVTDNCKSLGDALHTAFVRSAVDGITEMEAADASNNT